MDLTITPDALLDIIKELTEGLLEKRFELKTKKYDKIDFKVIDEGNEFLSVQVTKCSPGYPNLTFLLTKAMKKQLNSNNLEKRATVAEIEKKLSKNVRKQEVACSRKSSCSLIDVHAIKQKEQKEQNEFNKLKRYIAIKILLKIRTNNWQQFSSLLRCYIMNIEQLYTNVKFVFRKEDKTKTTYIYRNKVKMDDIILSCDVLSSSCAKILKMSQDVTFQNDLINKFGLKKKNILKRALDPLLYAQANNNINVCNV